MPKDPLVIICDDFGNPTGEYVYREKAHTGKGAHHLAITVLLYNSKDEVLLQNRKHLRFDGCWDLTGATDLYHKEDGFDENYEDATVRCLVREYGISEVILTKLGEFNYFAPDGKYCENEHCALMVGRYDGQLKLNPEVGYACRWVSKEEFLSEINLNSDKYSKWAQGSIPILQKNNFFD